MSRLAAWTAVGWLAVSAGCAQGAPEIDGEQVATEVEYAGCYAVERGPVCALTADRRVLSFWWPGGDHPRRVATEAGALAPGRAEPRGGGVRLEVRVPAGASRLELVLGSGARRRRFALALRETEVDPLVARVLALQRKGKAAEARAFVEGVLPGLTGVRRGLGHRARARLLMAEGAFDEAIAALRRSLPAFEEAGAELLVAKEASALAWLLLDRKQRYGEAREVLERALARAVPAGVGPLLQLAGALALQLGDLRTALHTTRDAYERAYRLGIEDDAAAARSQLAVVYKQLGRWAEALEMQRLIVAQTAADACAQSDALVDLALNLGALARTDPGAAASPEDDPARVLARAEVALGRCPDADRARNIALERGLWALERGDLGTARGAAAALARIEGRPPPRLAIWQLELAARLELAAGRPAEAARRFAAQVARAAALGLVDELVRGLVGRGRALERAGRPRAAIAAYRRAEAVVESWSARVPVTEGLHGFARARRDGAEELVAALLRLGRAREAMDAARAAHRRAILRAADAHRVARLVGSERARWEEAIRRYRRERAAVEAASADWTVAAPERARRSAGLPEQHRRLERLLDQAFAVLHPDARPPPPPRRPEVGEAIVTWFRAGGRWLGFVATRAGVRGVDLGAPALPGTPAALAARLLAPFAGELRRARHLTLVAPAELWEVDFHALPFAGTSLLARLPVAYATDLQPGAVGCLPPAQSRGVVVSNPSLDLPEAQREGARVAGALRAAAFGEITTLTGRAASHARVLERLDRATYFHFAGHGQEAGREGWESALRLAERTELRLGDILAIPAAPARVVLSACEGARTPGQSPGFSVAHAFIAAGSQAVLAATRRVPDAVAEALVEELYRHRPFDCSAPLAEAARESQLALARRHPDADWRAFRILAP